MKLSIFGMLFILIAMAVGPLVYFNGGKEYLNEMVNSKPVVGVTTKLNKDVIYSPVTTDKKIKVYKWKDKNGIWQFGNSPPSGLAGVETMTLQPNVNIMKPIDLPDDVAASESSGSGVVSLRIDKDKAKKAEGERDDDGVGISQESLDNPYAPESISELFKSSKNIQKMLDNRQKSQLNNQPK